MIVVFIFCILWMDNHQWLICTIILLKNCYLSYLKHCFHYHFKIMSILFYLLETTTNNIMKLNHMHATSCNKDFLLKCCAILRNFRLGSRQLRQLVSVAHALCNQRRQCCTYCMHGYMFAESIICWKTLTRWKQ